MQFAWRFLLPAVLSLVERRTSKGNAIGQSITGSNTLAHNSTTPTSSDTLKKVLSRPTAAAGIESWMKLHAITSEC